MNYCFRCDTEVEGTAICPLCRSRCVPVECMKMKVAKISVAEAIRNRDMAFCFHCNDHFEAKAGYSCTICGAGNQIDGTCLVELINKGKVKAIANSGLMYGKK